MMNYVKNRFSRWEDVVKEIREDDEFSTMVMPNSKYYETWSLNNDFSIDKGGNKIDYWIFTLDLDLTPMPRRYWRSDMYLTLDEALHAKIFDGESLYDLYMRNYDWFRDWTEEEMQEERNRRKKCYFELYKKKKAHRLAMKARGDIWWMKKTEKRDIAKEKALLNPRNWMLYEDFKKR